MPIIKNFMPMGGKHCITNALKQIFYYYGYDISEEMLFGIGSALGFTYINLASAPMISGRTKPFDFEGKIADRFNIQIKCKKSKDNNIAYQKAKQSIDAHKPVLVYGDMPYLNYLNLPENSHFGGHSVVIFGYDDEKSCFYVSDRDNNDFPITTPKGTISSDYHLVPYSEMEKSRGSSHRPFPANNKYLEFDFSGYRPITSEIIMDAVKETCDNMLNPPAKLLGVSGIDKFSKEILKWRKFEPEKRKQAGESNYFMINADGGTGGGIFRHMYGTFLIEAGQILDNNTLNHFGNQYISISYQWEEIASLLWQLSVTDDTELLKPMSDILKEICLLETDILSQLRIL